MEHDDALYKTWEDIIDRLDMVPFMPKPQRDFITDLIEDPPDVLNSTQVKQLQSLTERYLT